MSSSTQGSNGLSRLPEEITEQIFSHVASFKWPAANIKSLCLVSRQFRRIAQPMLPRHLRIAQGCILPLVQHLYHHDARRSDVRMLELTTDFGSACAQNGLLMVMQLPRGIRRWLPNEMNQLSSRWRSLSQQQQLPRNEHERWFRTTLIFMFLNLEALYIDIDSAPEHLFWSLFSSVGRDRFLSPPIADTSTKYSKS
jgi:F-box associated protein